MFLNGFINILQDLSIFWNILANYFISEFCKFFKISKLFAKFEINLAICEVIQFGNRTIDFDYFLDDNQIPKAEVIRDLGVYIDNQLKFSTHVSKLRSTCYRPIGLMFKIFHSKNSELYIGFYRIYLLPIIDYGSVLFAGNSKEIDRTLEQIQKLFTRKLYRRVFNSSLHQLFQITLNDFLYSNLNR